MNLFHIFPLWHSTEVKLSANRANPVKTRQGILEMLDLILGERTETFCDDHVILETLWLFLLHVVLDLWLS